MQVFFTAIIDLTFIIASVFFCFFSFPEGFHASARGCKVREDWGRQLAATEKSLSWCCREGKTCRHNKTCVWDQSTVKLFSFLTQTHAQCVCFMLPPLVTSLLYVHLMLHVCVCSERTNSTACGRTLWQPEGGAALTQPGRFTPRCCEGKGIKKFFDALIHWNISLFWLWVKAGWPSFSQPHSDAAEWVTVIGWLDVFLL